MIWSDAGNMGINVSDPKAKLDVGGDIKCTNLIITGTTTTTSTQDTVTVGNQTATNLIATNSISAGNAIIGNAYSVIETAPTNGLIIEGNVGIGTNSPSSKLEVNGNVQIGSHLILSSSKASIINSRTTDVDYPYVIEANDPIYPSSDYFNAYYGIKQGIFKSYSLIIEITLVTLLIG